MCLRALSTDVSPSPSTAADAGEFDAILVLPIGLDGVRLPLNVTSPTFILSVGASWREGQERFPTVLG